MKAAPPPKLKCPRAWCKADIPVGKITCVICGCVAFGTPRSKEGQRPDDGVKRLSEIEALKVERILSGFADRNWGPANDPGIAVCGITLLGGAPGAGKSTLCAQILSAISNVTGGNTLYVGSEENAEQVKARAVRLGLQNLEQMLILPLEAQYAGYKVTRELFERWKPRAWVLDSLQKYSESDQDAVKMCEDMKEITVKYRCPSIIISQVNKEEEFSGLQGQMHAVDTLISFTLAESIQAPNGRILTPPFDPENPDKMEPFRILKTTKNRDGDAYESYFTMHSNGLRPFHVPSHDEEGEEEEERFTKRRMQ